MKRTRLLLGIFSSLGLQAQLIPAGSPVPHTALPPVVFINGYQFEGCPTTFAGTFGIADQVLQSNGEVSLFFNTCSLPSTASIEDLGAAFATFLSGLTYTDGTPVEQVDVVAHSMGGLVLRCYLSGKQDTAGMFQPPAATHVRKVVFLATPHFGTPIASLLPLITQVEEMASGSEFLFDLGAWNDAADDLRGVDAVAAAGNGGTGLLTTAGFDDGVVPLTSASLRFYGPGRTRVVPYCHTSGGGLVSDVGLCPANAPGIADIDSASHLSAQIIVSFFNGTNAWQSVGTAAEDDPFLSVDGGLIVEADSAADSKLNINSATANSDKLGISSDNLAFSDMIAAGTTALAVTSGTTNISDSVALPAGGTEPFTVKDGPLIARVYPAAAALFPLELAPRMLISIYGTNLASSTVQVNGSSLPVFYGSASQINAPLPDNLSGLVQLTVQNSAGQHTVNLDLEAASPAIFTQNSSGTGPAAALLAPQLTLVTANNPLHPGDAVALYLTGLGATMPSNGLDVAVQQPTVTVEGLNCPVTFAGAAPGFTGLDQINCTIPSTVTSNAAAPVAVTSGDRTSNTATLAIQ
ncbi:MAG TPA: hypothetical protein VME17_20240 [Bryobacteraceae bacterium]|nr:hypothetical protein [Bryobacteraceae bacterium]